MANGTTPYVPITSGDVVQADPFKSPLSANTSPNSAAKSTDIGVVMDPSKTVPHTFDHPHEPDPTGPRDPVTTPASTLMDSLTSLNTAQMLQLQDKLIAAGYLASKDRSGADDDATRTAYYQLLQDTGNYNSAGVIITPDELLARRGTAIASSPSTSKTGAAARVGGTDSTSGVNLSDPLSAQALLDKVLTERLGRHPTADQKAQFTAALQAAQQANPNQATVTTTPVGAAGSTQTSSTSGGIDPTQFASNYTDTHFGQEQNNFQAASSLYDTALQVLGIQGR